jgi:hypothetical protein
MQQQQRLAAAPRAELHAQAVDLGEVLRAYGHEAVLGVAGERMSLRLSFNRCRETTT